MPAAMLGVGEAMRGAGGAILPAHPRWVLGIMTPRSLNMGSSPRGFDDGEDLVKVIVKSPSATGPSSSSLSLESLPSSVLHRRLGCV
jgi:hypothetical protein